MSINASAGKNILILPSWYPSPDDVSGGLFIRHHALEISKIHSVTVLSFRFVASPGSLWYKRQIEKTSGSMIEERVEIRDCGRMLNNLSLLILANWLVFTKLAFSRPKFDLVHLNVVYHLGVFLYPILALMRPDLVITEHWTGYFPEDGRYQKLGTFSRSIVRMVFSFARKVIVISESLKKQLDETFGISYKTVIVSNYLNAPTATRKAEAIPNGRVEVLTISYMDDRMKGISGLLDAFSIMLQQFPDSRLTIIGGGHDLIRLLQYAQSKGLTEEHVLFTGPLANGLIPGYYQRSSFFVLNSNFETFNIATAEALLYGLPVVVTKCRGPEAYVDDRVGIKIRKGDTVALAEAMIQMAQQWRRFDSDAVASMTRDRLLKTPLEEQFREVFGNSDIRPH